MREPPLQRLMAHLGYTGKRDIYGENDQVTGAEDLEATGFQRLYTLGNDGQLKPYTPASWAEAVQFMDAGNVLMVPEESPARCSAWAPRPTRTADSITLP